MLLRSFIKSFLWCGFMFCRHSAGHEYFDPNDFLEGMQHEIEREELEYEVIHTLPFLLPHLPR